MASIIDVARLASVSIATVSRFFSAPSLLAQGTREKVQRAVDELGFEPNQVARALRTERTSKILVTVPDISNSFFGNIIRGAEEEARRKGYSIILGDTRNELELERQYALMLRRKEVDGLIFLGHHMPAAFQSVMWNKEGNPPIVNGCEYSPDLPYSSVHIDNREAAAAAIDYLASLGHRHIGVITGPPESPISRDRLEGVTNAADRLGITGTLEILEGDYSVDCGFAHTGTLLKSRVSAIFCFSDEMAIGALSAISGAGLSCPGDISVIGFDDIRFASYLTPRLTTIAQPSYEIGQEVVRLLLRILNGSQKKVKSITLPHNLMVRDSTGPVHSAGRQS